MAERIIPKRTKVKMEFFKGITVSDIVFALIVVGVALLIFTSNFEFKIYLGVAWCAIGVSLFIPAEEGIRIYTFLGLVFRFFAFRKRYAKDKLKRYAPIKDLIPFEGIVQDKFIDYGEYKAMVLEVRPVSFGLFNEEKQDLIINTFANGIRRITANQSASIVKISKPMVLDDYIYNEDKKFDGLAQMVEKGEVTQKELESRAGVFEARVASMQHSNTEEKQYKDHFYFVVYDKDKEALVTTIEGIKSSMAQSVMPIHTNILNADGLAIFLKANYGKEFNERDLESTTYDRRVDWISPKKVDFRMATTTIDDITYKNFIVADYPLHVGNAWGYPLFSLERTRVVVNFHSVPKIESEKVIDKAIMETETKLERTGKSSQEIEYKTQLDTLRELLNSLKNNNELLYEANIHIRCEEPVKKEVRAILRQYGFKYTELFGRQVDAFVSSQISMRDTIKEYWRGIPTTTFAAIFPFVSSSLQDEKGFYIGYNEYPVFVNLFARNSERVNSNMMIIGKSGSGKSYATKTLLSNLAADNAKIFILDPEDEYLPLSRNLCGKVMDVGSSASGIFNPFNIMTTLEADSGEEDDSFALHLQFLEQFFRIILEGMTSDAFELLNSVVPEVYRRKGIDSHSRIEQLSPEDFPIFDDLMAMIREKRDLETDPYRKQNFQTIETYIEKFSSGGRNSNLWNGPTSIQTKENFVTFNFRTLLANRNKGILSAQMLLVFKYLDNEIIKNRDFNLKYHVGRKIIIVVDEAHVFINPQYPIALDFMVQMAKRIRKYNGMQIVITQNIKDFVGSPEIARQSTAIINACQYSFIFSLAPNDITDLVELYRNAGEINKEEQNSIVTAGVGNCFLITGALSRTMVQIDALPYIKELFKE